MSDNKQSPNLNPAPGTPGAAVISGAALAKSEPDHPTKLQATIIMVLLAAILVVSAITLIFTITGGSRRDFAGAPAGISRSMNGMNSGSSSGTTGTNGTSNGSAGNATGNSGSTGNSGTTSSDHAATIFDTVAYPTV
ncbi:MAG: hypothetical protein LBL67_03245 [Coriobacteriales bacterium]|jgi:hypothetical protein|nr:hypothetical protein [Coriobacteriales bacterium]